MAMLAWRFPRTTKTDATFSRLAKLQPYSLSESPTLHSTSGIPTLQQLTANIEMEPKLARLAQSLDDIGLAQYNRPVNNRDGIIQDSHREIGRLRSYLKASEVALAEKIGVLLATTGDNVERMRIA